MTKLLSAVIAAMFAAVSVNAIAASHTGAPKADDKKMEKKAEKGEKKAKAETKPKAEKKPKATKEAKGDKPMAKKDAEKK